MKKLSAIEALIRTRQLVVEQYKGESREGGLKVIHEIARNMGISKLVIDNAPACVCADGKCSGCRYIAEVDQD